MAHVSQPEPPSAVIVSRDGVGPAWRCILSAIICSLGGTAFGYDLGALSSAASSLAGAYRLSPALLGLTVSASLWGAVCASLVAGRLADSLGRRSLLAICAFLYMLAAGLLAVPVPFPWMAVLALRLLAGMAIGGFVVGCPLYLAEIAPRLSRGRFVGLFQFQIGIGVTLAFAASAIVAHHVADAAVWKWCFGLGAIPPACLFVLLPWVPEEPHWLAGQGWWRDAAAAAARLGFSEEQWPRNGDIPAAELPSPASQERLFCRRYLRPLLLATSVALFNQLSGVNIFRIYLLDLLSSAGMSSSLGHLYGILISFLNLAALLLGMMFVDKLGRRPLLVLGSAVMSICMFALGLAIRNHIAAIFFLVIFVAYNTFFAVSQGAVAWVYLSELFPFPVRGKGQSYGALVHWVANATLIWIFPVLDHLMPRGSFNLLASMMVLQIVIVLVWYPETKGTRLGMVAGAAGIRA